MTLRVERRQRVASNECAFSRIAHFVREGGWRGAPEQEQALLRIAITVISLLYLLTSWPGSDNAEALWTTGIQIAFAFLAYSALFFVVTLAAPAPSVPRRVVAVIGDVGMTTLVLYLTGPMGAPWYGVYLWVTLGNGFRYGEKFLYLSGLASLLGFLTVVLSVPYWEQHVQLAVGLGVTLLVIPSYCAVLIRRLNEATAQADAASRAKSDFLSRMSHEIRTPLNGILGMTDLLRTSSLDTLEREYVETIYASGKALAHQIDEILDLSKIEAGQLSLEQLEFDLYALINTTLRIFEPQVSEKKIQLQELIDPKTPFLLYGDPHKLRQIIINLVNNSLKFTDHGFVSLRVYPIKQTDDHVTLRFEVADTGGGIAPDRLDKIFEPFAQADISIARSHGGTGLGTTICKNLVELMGGQIGVQSTVDLGTTFWFDLPFPTGKIQPSEEGRSWTHECYVVYLKLDESSDSGVAKSLHEWEIPFETANTVEEARRLIAENAAHSRATDALILDGVLPLEKLEHLRSQADAGQIHGIVPVIVFGINAALDTLQESEHDQIFSLGAPVDKRLLFNTLHACYSRRSTEDDVIHIAHKQNGKRGRGAPLSVLIGDDNATNRLVLQRMLEKMGYRTVAVSGGELVLTALEKSQFDVAIIDKNMPDMSGIDVFTAYTMAHGGKTHTQFIVLTADATAESRDSCFAAGIQYFLTKPVSLAKLQEVFSRITTRRRQVEQDHQSSDYEIEVPGVPSVVCEEDVEKLRTLAGDDEEFLTSVVTNFEKDARHDIRALELAVASRDWLAFKDAAHALKGASMYVGLHYLAELSTEAQRMDQEAFDLDGIRLIERIKGATDTALSVLRSKLTKHREVEKKVGK